MYKLKPNEPPFQVVDGPMAGRKFDHAGLYAEIPLDKAHRFSGEADELKEQRRDIPLAAGHKFKEKQLGEPNEEVPDSTTQPLNHSTDTKGGKIS